jgi:hypothetical protein
VSLGALVEVDGKGTRGEQAGARNRFNQKRADYAV